MFRNLILLFLLFIGFITQAQHLSSIQAYLNTEQKTISIEQNISYHNTSKDTLNTLFFNDWAHAFSSKTTPLAIRFAEDFIRKFHYSKEKDRGHTDITYIKTDNNTFLEWKRPSKFPDIIKVNLPNPLYPNQKIQLQLKYTVKIPNSKFTRYGFDKNNNFNLRYWHIVPAVYNNKWQLYSHKNLNDQYTPLIDYSINFTFPSNYTVNSNLPQKTVNTSPEHDSKTVRIEGKNSNEFFLYVQKSPSFYHFSKDHIEIVSDIDDNDLLPQMKSIALNRILSFLEQKLGSYPFDKILVSEIDYKNNKLYGINQLPDFIRPFPDGFQYEIKQLKTISEHFIRKTLLINPRHETWIKNAIHMYLMIKYIETYYPDLKMVGNISNIIGIRWFHLADRKFNDQYYLGFKHMNRIMKSQALNKPQDELVKFNKKIANPSKAGIGFQYLEDFLGNDGIVEKSIAEYYMQNQLKVYTNSNKDFKKILTQNSSKNIEWFFNDYIDSNEKLDFKIRSIKKRKNSIEITIKNKHNHAMPVSISTIKNKKVISKTWVTNINKQKTITISNKNPDKLILDYEKNIPEINRGNNYKNLKGILNKPIKITFLEDLENPAKNQLFLIPEFDYNVYDGVTIMSKFHNSSFIKKNFTYKFVPGYGFNSKLITGSASILYNQPITDSGLYKISYQISGNQYSYAPELTYQKLTPSITLNYRSKDLRSNEKRTLSFRNVYLFREKDEKNFESINTPNYSVFNVRYQYQNNNLNNSYSNSLNYQVSKNFSKISVTYNYKKLFLNNRHINFRLFLGGFIFNDTQKDKDFFSFALDRPTDYLFDYNYLGRSESTGLVSQEIIVAEGGFKSKLKHPFANQWITTFNTDTNIWNWIFLYGDLGIVKNKGNHPKFLFDAGIRLNLVTDYLELFFPIVSNKGWEINQPDYGKQVRFIIAISPQTLFKLFTREWY